MILNLLEKDNGKVQFEKEYRTTLNWLFTGAEKLISGLHCLSTFKVDNRNK